ncbi:MULTISPECIES: LysR family transcriptional regulator [unclassified Streptomyces]|uniref:LysR family transcriptional regulator n=1 Tax=unclassified Streptomyces TaxID=2593676 RepID=UPI0033A7CE45
MHSRSPDEHPAPQPAGSPRPVDPRRLRADDLRYLLAVSRTGRLVTAADALGVDHTTVSRRIAALEKRLGLRLIERGTEGWTLTDIGRAVAENARAIEEAIDRVVDTVAGQDSPSLHGTVRVSAPDGFGTAFATPALVRVRRRHPRLQAELITATRQLALRPSGFDLALVIGVPSTSRLVTEHLTDYALGLYASEDYLTRYGRPETVAELREHPLIFYIESMLQVGDLDIRLPITLAVRRDAVTHPAVRALWAALRHEVTERATELLPG